MNITENGLTREQESLVKKAIEQGMTVKSRLFLVEVSSDELTLHIQDEEVPSGMRSLRWYGIEDVTEEYIS